MIDAGKVIVASRVIADGDLFDGVMNPHAESKILENDSSEYGISREKIFWPEMRTHILHF